MALTVKTIKETEDNQALVELLMAELQRLLPAKLHKDRARYLGKIRSLPAGLRAMAGTYLFSVSMTLDSLAWHFKNENDERDLKETSSGLKKLGLADVAESFEKARKIMEPHFVFFRSDEFDWGSFGTWLEKSGANRLTRPMEKPIRKRLDAAGEYGLLEFWIAYARKHPDRCVVRKAIR
jgi:hypothetical protein